MSRFDLTADRHRKDKGVPENQKTCVDPNHLPVFKMKEPGMYEHFCPACRKHSYYTVIKEGN